MNERQQKIIELLSHASTSVSLEQIASFVNRSKRTVLRDLSGIKIFLEEQNVGSLITELGKGYHIEIVNSNAYQELLQETINDEEIILYELVQNEYLTMDALANLLYVSKITASEKMNLVISQYENILNVEVSRKGHHLNASIEKRCFILSNLVKKNTKKYLDAAHMSKDTYYQLENLMENNREISENFPNATIHEIISLIIASRLLNVFTLDVAIEDQIDFNEYMQGTVEIDEKMNAILNIVSQHCIEVSLNLSKEQVIDVLHLINFDSVVDPEVFHDLAERLYEHIKRMLGYPYYVQIKTPYNIAKIRTMNPLAFDLAMNFIHYFERMYHYEITNPDFVGLYFTVCLQRSRKETKKIVLIADSNAIAYLNKQLLLDYIPDIEVEISDVLLESHKNQASLIVDSKLKYNDEKDVPIYPLHNIITDQDVSKLKAMMNSVYIKQNRASLFPKEMSFEYHVTNPEWEFVLEDVCMRLLRKKAISQSEMNAILSREKKGSALLIQSFALPHCISEKENVCSSFYIYLDAPIVVDQQEIRHLLITVTDPVLNKKINIFKFLYNFINDNQEELNKAKSYEDFIQWI